MTFLFISPNFPRIYSHFVKALKDYGFTVLGIGDSPYYEINEELKANLTEYRVVSNMLDYGKMVEAVRYYENKYGHIDYLESNNEYWLVEDAKLRKEFHIATGLQPEEMDKIKYKSKMKEHFERAGVKTARYILVGSLEESLTFVKAVGFPVFVKPDCGVGAYHSYKIANMDELVAFHNKVLETTYIMEEFIEGCITSFDGICDDESNVVLAFNEHFPIPVADVVNNNLDDYYYASTTMDSAFEMMGRRVVKAFGIKKRPFHIEFFELTQDKPGLALKGEIIALEVNMRSPGGDTPDLLSIAFNNSYYQAYASVIKNNAIDFPLNEKRYLAISVSKKDAYKYRHSDEDIKNAYGENLIKIGTYPKSISLAMGDTYYYARFDGVEDALSFARYVQEKL